MNKRNRATSLSFCAAVLLLSAALTARADTPKVGDRVECLDSPTQHHIGRVAEIDGQKFRIVYENDDSDPSGSGYWFWDYALNNHIYLVDASGKRIKDYHPRPGDPSPTAPGAQSKGTHAFHVGDRVDTRVAGEWYPGTVTQGLIANGYRIAQDRYIGKGFPDTIAVPEDVRASLSHTQAPKIPSFPPMRPPIRTPKLGKAQAGPPSLALTKTLIQALWEDQLVRGTTVNFDIHSAEIGAPRRWVVGNDLGPGNQTTIVYPVKVRSTTRSYHENSVDIAEEEGTYKMYIDLYGKWHIGLENSKNLKPLQSIYFE